VQRVLQERIPDLRRILMRHEFASRGMQELDNWNNYYKFAFVRNPWDRLVSWYSMVTALPNIPKTGNALWRYARENSSTFEEFIYNCTDEVEIKEGVRYSFAYNQLDYVTDEHGDLLVDFIGRVENIAEDLQKVLRRIGLKLETVPHDNPSDHRHYSTFYAPDTEMIVRERFKRDIDYFGYEFERGDTPEDTASTEKISVSLRQSGVTVRANGGPQVTRAGIRAGTPKEEPPRKPGLLFVCGCDKGGTTALANYLNRHPEILVCQESSETIQQGEVSLDLTTVEGTFSLGPKETEDSDGGGRLVMRHAESLAKTDPARLRWIGATNSDYMRRMESVAANNPGARFIVMYRPIEEVAESREVKGVDAQNSNNGFEQAVQTWNRGLQGTRRFIRDSLVPRVLVLSYHDFLYRTEAVVPLISRFLEVEFDESATLEWADEHLQFEKGRRPEERLEQEKRSLIQKQANRSAEAWILDRIDKQWTKPALYVQESSMAALATSLDEMEAKTWRLQQRVKELERDIKLRRRRFKQLKSSRTWRLLNRISGIRAKIVGR
jgi:hypothetical protein